MAHKISILVRADVDRDTVELLVSGCLTEQTQSILASQIVKARSLGPSSPVLVDLSGAQHIVDAALDQLRAIEQVDEMDGHPLQSLRFVLPETAPMCPLPDDVEPAGS